CSLQELAIEGKLVPKAYAEGIYVLPATAVPGENALPLLGLDDKVLEFDLTPNRSDALSMIGVAYEVGAILSQGIELPKIAYSESAEKAEDVLKLRIDALEENPMYVAKVVKNVKIAESPLWLQNRLMAAGIRPHNNVVDITNYILLEYGQPLHAFDYDRLGSKEIVVRHASEGEKFVTLDDQERVLKGNQLVITNGSEPVALAGVMGGANSEVKDDTVNVLIESAYFKGLTVRQASKDHGLRSEASARFEKGIDPNRTRVAADRAAELMAEYASGEVVSGTVEVDTLTVEPAVVAVSLGRINDVLGTELSMEEVQDIMNRLQFENKVEDETIVVTVPTRRGDITIEEDIVEEVARMYGYDNLPTTLPVTVATPGKLTEYQLGRRKVRRFLEGAGLAQTTTYSLTSAEKATQFALNATSTIGLAMPMSEDRSILRQSLVPHLLEAVKHNNARQSDSIALYETGSVF